MRRRTAVRKSLSRFCTHPKTSESIRIQPPAHTKHWTLLSNPSRRFAMTKFSFSFAVACFYYSNLLFFNCKHHRKTSPPSPYRDKKYRDYGRFSNRNLMPRKLILLHRENLCKIAFNGCLLKYKLDLHADWVLYSLVPFNQPQRETWRGKKVKWNIFLSELRYS